MDLEEIIAKKRAYIDDAKALVTSQFKAFFEKYPNAKSITWKQYTPYFNDGDACTFSVREMELRLFDVSEQVAAANTVSQWPVDLDDEDYQWGEGCVGDLLHNYGTDAEKELLAGYHAICASGSEIKDVFREVFGDHALITATAAGIDVRECSHD